MADLFSMLGSKIRKKIFMESRINIHPDICGGFL